jgi:ribosomal protein S27AE
MHTRGLTAAWFALALVAAGGWFLTGTKISSHLGLGAASPAVGVAAAAAVVVTIWRWARVDREQRALVNGVCPRCAARLASRHEHARPGALSAGLVEWQCGECGWARTEPLTCERCAS